MLDIVNIVFCADRRVLPGLHIAAYSLLERISSHSSPIHFSVFSDDLDNGDIALLEQTLAATGKQFQLELRRIDASQFGSFRPLNGSRAAYYRLVIAQVLEVDRFLYIDCDTLCDIDVCELIRAPMGGAPAALVPEAMLATSVDRHVAEQLGNGPDEPYFNSGVMLVNVAEWRRQKITEQCFNYIATHQPIFHDQSALNFVLYRKAFVLDARFNCIANMRKNWPALRQPRGQIGRLVHFVDYPKPWDFLGEFVNPHYRLWHSVLTKTALQAFQTWHATPARRFPLSLRAWTGYRKALKDRWLFTGYARGWLMQVKGVPVKIVRQAL